MSNYVTKADLSTIIELQRHGDDGSKARPVSIWLFGEKRDLSEIETILEAAGWNNHCVKQDDDGYFINAVKTMAVSGESIGSLNRFIERTIESKNVEFDGWESEVV